VFGLALNTHSMSLTAGIEHSSRGQWLAFALALSVAVLACIVALFGAWWLGDDAVDSDPPADD